MKQGEAGFFLMEVVVALAIGTLIAGGAAMVTFRAFTDTQRTNNHMTILRHVENAGYWISRDTQMADSLITENLTAPEFLIVKYTQWGYNQDSIYHSVTYSIEDVSAGMGTLKRRHQDSAGADEQMVVAEYIYYNPGDPETTQVSYQSPMLNLKVVGSLRDAQEIKEQSIYRRPNF